MGTISGGGAERQFVNVGRLGQTNSQLSPRINQIDTDDNGNLSVAEIKSAADTDQSGDVSEAEADQFVNELRDLAKPPVVAEGDTAVVRGGRFANDSVSKDALAKVREAAMGPVDAQVEFTFTRMRYASVFCTRF